MNGSFLSGSGSPIPPFLRRKNYNGLVNVQSLGEHAGIASTDVTPLSVELCANIQEIGAPLAHVVRM